MIAKLRLSQIKLAGFKSFVDPTHIHLPGQIVGVVGPNGCGKSNVIDALRWVLGESKASALRGESMQDVIFNGSSKRKPVARASVELVFDNEMGKAAGQWSSYAQISIKRILQRNGESSYHINNQKVRRRDITDIFLGTGLGARAYAIVEQGMISRIIEAKPEELRVFLEEAAGVSRYRDRRRDTSNRLADTRDNLLRIGDILLEMDKQLAHLTAQAESAQRYHELEKQRTTCQQLFWLLKKQEAEGQRGGYTLRLEKIRTELEAQTALLRETENQLETARSGHFQLSEALHTTQGELYSSNADIARLEQQIEHDRSQRKRLQLQIDNIERQIEGQRAEQQQALSQLEHWQQEQQDALVNLAQAEQNAALEGDILPQAEQAAQNAQSHYNALQREQLQAEQQVQLTQTRHENLLRNISQMQARSARLLQELENLPHSDPEELQLVREELTEQELTHQVCCDQLVQLQGLLPAADAERHQARSALQQQEKQLVQIEARWHALQKMQLQLDSDKNLAGWLQKQGLADSPPLWQAIRITSGWESALEAVLRERLNAIQMEAALADCPPGRLALYSTAGDKADNVPSGMLTPLLNHIDCQDERVRPVLCDWLSRVYAVDDLSAAYQMRVHLPDGGVLVTPEGHLIGTHSVVFHAPDTALHGVLARQREIAQLALESDVLEREVALANGALVRADQHYRAIEAQISPLQRDIHEQKQLQHSLQMQLFKLTQAQEKTRERALQIELEMQELGDLLDIEQEATLEIDRQLAQLTDEAVDFGSRVDEAQQQAVSLDSRLREQRVRAQQLQQARQEAVFFARTCADKINGLNEATLRIAEALMQSAQTAEQLRAELHDNADDTVLQSLQDALQGHQFAQARLSDARVALEAATAGLQTLEQQRMCCEQNLNQLREQLAAFALKEQESRLYAEQWATQLQGVDEVVLLPLLAVAKSSSLQNEISQLASQIDALGAVNLAALEELQTARERKTYLDAQAQDLQEAMDTLEAAIKHIDRESRDLLMDTYNRVNLQLAELFPILFAGGEAKLVLTGEEILDSGVQVMAQPPGKKNSSIHLLSGGEKALTAIALIFSLFQLNPAPFCLLDEVDAPLDDTNTERLCALVRKMSQHTQFVFISHNKIAMEMAQQLIGVTMQEKGVSKVVSVDIEAALRMRDE